MQLCISNLHTSLSESDVQRLFSRYGEVAASAIFNLNKSDLKGKKIAVSEVAYDPASDAAWRFSHGV